MDEHRQGVATNGARAESRSEQGWGKDLPNDDPRKKPEHKRPEPEKGKGESVGASIVQKFIQEVWSDSRLAEAIDSAVADALASPPAAVRCDNAPEWDFSVTERRIITRVVASWLRERGVVAKTEGGVQAANVSRALWDWDAAAYAYRRARAAAEAARKDQR